MRVNRGCLAMSLVLLASVLPAIAQSDDRRGPFVGLSWGQNTVETNSNTIDQVDCGSGIPCGISESSDMWKFFGGLRFNKWAAFESSLRTFGDAKGAGPDQAFAIEAQAWDFYLRGQVPLGPVDLFGKLGFSWVDGEYAQTCLPSSCVSGIVDFSGATWAGGLGIIGNIGNIGLRLEWEPYQVSSFDRWDVVSVGIQYRFGS